MTSTHPRPAHPATHLTTVWQSASLLLHYPDERQRADLDVVRRAAATLPRRLGAPLLTVVDHLAGGSLGELQERYVATFDHRRRTNLFLTYFAHGDTRKRGIALLRFKQTYLGHGHQLDDSELPDHLCVVLEFAATVDQASGWELLLDHRAGLELLRLGLAEEDNPWAGAVEAVCATLPPLRGEEREAIGRLAADGPPEEEVGLTPYGTPQFDAALHERVVDLPMPTVPSGARGA